MCWAWSIEWVGPVGTWDTRTAYFVSLCIGDILLIHIYIYYIVSFLAKISGVQV